MSGKYRSQRTEFAAPRPRRRRLRALAASALVASALGSVAEGLATAAPASAAGPATQVVFTTMPPSLVVAGQQFTVRASVEDAQGNVVTTRTDSIELSFDVYAPGVSLYCNGGTSDVVAAVQGVATFDCSIDVTGDYDFGLSDLTDTGVGSPGISSFVGVDPGPVVGLGFTIQPGAASVDAPFLTEVSAVDAYGNAELSDSTDQVSLSLSGGTGGATLGCTPAGGTSPSSLQTLSFGAADFDCSVDTAGTGYTLVASNPNGTFSPVASSAFDIGAESAALAMVPSAPVNVNGNGTFTVDLTLTGANGNPISGHQVEIDYGPGQAGSGNTATTDASGDAAVTGNACPADEPTFEISGYDDTSRTQLATIDATCVGVNFPTQDSVGFTDSFNVLASQPDQPVAVSFAATPSSAQVEAAPSGTCTTDAGGNLAYGTCNFTVPPVPGVTPPAPVTAFVTVGTTSYEIDGFQLLPATSVQLTPSSGPAGTSVDVTLGGFAAGEQVDVYYGDLGQVGSCSADPSGACTASITVPAAPAGSYVVEADGATSGELADANFAATSAVSVTPNDVAPDTNVSLALSGFGANEVVNVTVAGAALGHCTTDTAGSCTTAGLVPGNAPGGVEAVVATGASSADTASTTLTVTGVQLTSSTGVAGSTFTAGAVGFQPHETVDFYYNAVKQASCTAGATGTCSAGITVPAAEAHTYTVIATGETSGLSGRAQFTELASLTFTPTSGPEDTPVQAAVTGFLPGETVNILNAGSSIGSCSADGTGSCVANMFAPVAGAGTYTLTAHGSISGTSASAPFTVTGATLALSPASGPSGSQISASATGFVPGETVDFSYDGAGIRQCTADPSGSCGATVTVPSGPGGNYTVSANGTSGHAVATATFTRTPTLTLYPPAGLPGSTFQATATGFAANDVVDFTYGNGADGSCDADASGDCTAQLAVPADGPGAYAITGLGVSGLSATATFTQTVALTLSPNLGGVGTTFQANGAGFMPAETVDVYFNGVLSRSCLAGTNGTCSAAVTVPNLPVGAYTVTATGLSSGVSASFSFNIVPVLTLTPNSGAPGSSYTAVATGFQPDLEIFVYFGGVGEAGQCAADATGSCTVQAVVPPYPAAAVNVAAFQPDSAETANATYDVIPSVTLGPSSGAVGSVVSMTARGFPSTAPDGGAESLVIWYGGVFVGQCSPTDASGGCTTTFVVPAGQPSGPNTVLVFDGHGEQASATFDQTSAASLVLTPSTGSPGSTFNWTVSGFAPSENVSLSFDGAATGSSCATDAAGTCSIGATVPTNLPAGSYPVTATGSTGDHASAAFQITPALALVPASGEAGGSFTAEASGFASAEQVSISFNGSPTGSSCTTDASGSCSAAPSVPLGLAAAPYAVTATGQSSHLSANATFTTEGSLQLAPNEGPAGTTTTAEATGFAAGEGVSFTYNGLAEGSCVADGSGSCNHPITVPAGAAGSYIVRAQGVSSGDIATAIFTLTGSLVVSPSAGAQGDPFNANVSGFLPGENVQIVFHGENVGSCSTNASGSCSTPANVPVDVPAGSYNVTANGAGGDSAGAAFTVNPALALTPSSGQQGAPFTAVVSGFAAGETVQITFAGSLVGACSTNPAGDCSTPAAVPAGIPAATYQVTATGQSSSLTAKAPFSETPSVTLSPPSGPPGSAVTVNAIGFTAGETVNITYNGFAAGHCTADPTGACSTQFAVPIEPAGTYPVTATGAVSGLAVTASFAETSATPVVSAVTPSSGPLAGGTAVTVTGTGFVAGATVSFGTVKASNVVVVNGATITATSPAGAAGSVNVRVTTSAGTSATSSADRFTYLAVPTVTKVAPATGPTAGGTSVTITGTAFAAPAAVSFANVPATNVVVVNGTTVTATAPARSAGTVDVTVRTPGGTSATSAADRYTYAVRPTVTAVSPNAGKVAGGTAVTITGTGFAAGATVFFGGTKAGNVTVVDATTITANSPAGSAGTVDVTVTTAGGTSATSASDLYTYEALPTVTAVAPAAGPTAGGTTVTITGTGFVAGASVSFANLSATNVVVVNATTITATSPAHGAGTVNVTVTTPGGTSGTSSAARFTYLVAPTVTKLAPSSGPAAGGTAVTINGTGFVAGATVAFGNKQATNVVVVSATTITATAPAGSAGTVNVTVTTPGGTSAVTAADRYTYV
jgi:hypothetical protein